MPKKELTYSEAISKIEEILNKIENEELDIDQLAKNVKLASELMKFCKSKLHDTENEVEKILENIDNDDRSENEQ